MKDRAERSRNSSRNSQPAVSIIVAARNEEANIRHLLASFAALRYPREKLQFLFGDDGSTDSTHSILQAWKGNFPQCQVFQINEQVPGLTGKGNVLAQLCRHATGDILLFTDADCRVPPGWVASMTEAFQEDPSLGILTGITLPEHKNAFEKLQAVDWIVAQFVIFLMSLVGLPITAVGNNMAISARAYKKSGGFEATAGGITEDHAIFHHIKDKGFPWAHRFSLAVMAATQPMPDKATWLEQRVRWFSGAMKLPFLTQLPYWFQMFFYPVLLVLTPFIGWQWALFAIAMKVGFQTVLYMAGLIALRLYRLLPWALAYEPWSVWACWVLWLEWLRTPVIVWKGREFSKANA